MLALLRRLWCYGESVDDLPIPSRVMNHRRSFLRQLLLAVLYHVEDFGTRFQVHIFGGWGHSTRSRYLRILALE